MTSTSMLKGGNSSSGKSNSHGFYQEAANQIVMDFIKAIPMMKAVDTDKSLDFYTRLLDFEVDERWPLEGLPSFANRRLAQATAVVT